VVLQVGKGSHVSNRGGHVFLQPGIIRLSGFDNGIEHSGTVDNSLGARFEG
jgi:hypothetical protein